MRALALAGACVAAAGVLPVRVRADCDSAKTQGDLFKGWEWLGFVLALLVIPIGVLLLLWGLPFQRYTRRIFGFFLGLSVSLYACLLLSVPEVWLVPLICLPSALLLARFAGAKAQYGIMIMGFMFGVFLGFSVVVVGLYVLYDGAIWPTDAIIAVFGLGCAGVVFKAKRRWSGCIPGRMQLIPIYTSLLGAICIVQPINFLTFNNMHGYMVVNCDKLPETGVYVFLAIVYGLSACGTLYQVSFGEKVLRIYFEKHRMLHQPSRRQSLLLFMRVSLGVFGKHDDPNNASTQLSFHDVLCTAPRHLSSQLQPPASGVPKGADTLKEGSETGGFADFEDPAPVGEGRVGRTPVVEPL